MAIIEFDSSGVEMTLKSVYTTDTIFRAFPISGVAGETGVRFVSERLSEPLTKTFTSKLGEKWWDKPRCFTYERVGGEKVGYVEVALESWNNRLRVTNLWVDPTARREGIGRALMGKALEVAREMKARAVVLETQTCNFPAISLYRSCGFAFTGCDLTAYSNSDVKKNEVRLELVRTI